MRAYVDLGRPGKMSNYPPPYVVTLLPSGPVSQWGFVLASHWRVLPSKGTKVYSRLSLKALFAPQRAQKYRT